MSLIREGTAFTRSTVALVLTTFLALILSPTAAAARLAARDPSTLLGKSASVAVEADKLNDALKQVKSTLGRIDASLQKGAVPAAELKALVSLRADLVAADKDVIAAFARDLEHIKKRNLPAVIEQRHAKAMADYQGRQARMLGYLDALAALKNPTALKAKVKEAGDWLAKQQLEPAPAPFDPNKLGFQVETKKARAPKLTSKELKALFPAKVPVNTSANEWSEPLMVASAGSMAGLIAASAIAPPGAEYLAPTIDVQITPEIQALAAQLHHSPVEIHNWVRNNIEWIPTYGSVQGSALTLDKKTGNAFDTSSLLIALLRASGIPARYVYGTIQVPIAQAMNWAGGFTHPDAAQTFLATGGIPNNALTSGGVTKYLRMEHVWVEAFVDFYPSRGARNLAPDTWVPMDASYKQYSYTEGLDLQAGVPFDAEGFLTAAQDGATVNEQEGWVQNLNQANIQSRLTAYQQQLQSFIESQSPDATVGQVLGAKTIQPINAPVLAASLPYQLIATGNRYSALPDSLRHKFQYSLYASAYERSIENPLWTYQESTPNLASKKVTLSFVPASDADRQTIESYLPRPHEDGSQIQPEEFPSSLPAYNIRVTAELRVEGNVVASGGTFTLGTELVGEGGFTYLHNLGEWDLTQEQHVAGQASALGISLQGIGAKQLSEIAARIQATREKFGQDDVAGLTAELRTGDFLTSALWSYFVATEAFGRFTQSRAGMVDKAALSYGFFHTKVAPEFRYGLVHRAKFPGVGMDIGHVRRTSFSKANDMKKWASFNRLRGQHASTMEHSIPEQFITNPSIGVTGEGISAVKALKAAGLAGQKTYLLTSGNDAQLSSLQHSTTVMSNIRAALSAGKNVVIHERPVTHAGFTGAGYVVFDPETGGGSYLIEGGSNGSFFAIALVILMGTLDSLLAYKDADDLRRLYPARSTTKLVGDFLAKAAAALTFAKTVYDTATNDNLSALQKIGMIVANLVAAILGVLIGEAIVAAFLPLGTVLALTLFTALVLAFAADVVVHIIETSAYRPWLPWERKLFAQKGAPVYEAI